jgi:hypothetical protein
VLFVGPQGGRRLSARAVDLVVRATSRLSETEMSAHVLKARARSYTLAWGAASRK